MKSTRAAVFVWVLALSRWAGAELPPIEPYRNVAPRVVAADIPVEVVTLHREWRFDCSDDEQVVVGKIVSAAPASDGRVLLVDSQQCQVLVIAPNGAVERVVGRRGPGPGELIGAFRAVQISSDRIGIVAGADAPIVMIGSRGNIVWLDDNGDPAGEYLAGGDPGTVPVCVLRELRYAGSGLLVATYRCEVEYPMMSLVLELAVLDARSGAREIVARKCNRMDIRDEAMREVDGYEPFSGGRCDISRAGRLALAPERDQWLLAVRNVDGSWVVLERPWVPAARSAMSKERARKGVGDDSAEIFDKEPAMGLVRWRPDGKLWVEPIGVDLPANIIACFDELSEDLTLVRRVHLEVPGLVRGSELLVMEDGRFVLLEGFSDDSEHADDPVAPAATLLTLEESHRK